VKGNNKMNLRNYLLFTVSCAASIANSAYADPVECHGNDCDITVTVNSCDNIVFEPDALSTDHAVNLRWTIVTEGYNFVEDSGIQFSDPQFEVKHAPHSNEFHVHDNKSTTGTFPYTVHLDRCPPADPYIQNR